MFERLHTVRELYQYKLGAALTMEQTVLEILEASVNQVQDPQVETMFARHRSDSERHVGNLEEVFRRMGWTIATSPCPAIAGLQAESLANAKKVDRAIVDAVLLEAAVEVEHHEISVYEGLIGYAQAEGRKDVVELLTRNLVDEQKTLRLAGEAHRTLATDALRPEPGMLDRLRSIVGR